MEIKCGSDCREDLIKRIGDPVQKTSIKWVMIIFVSIFFSTLGFSYGIYSKGLEKRERAIGENSSKISEIKTELKSTNKEILNEIKHLNIAQEKLEKLLNKILEEIKETRHTAYPEFP